MSVATLPLHVRKTGMRLGDIILELNGLTIDNKNAEQVRTTLLKCRPDKPRKVKIRRRGLHSMDGNVLYFDLPLGGLGLKFEGELVSVSVISEG